MNRACSLLLGVGWIFLCGSVPAASAVTIALNWQDEKGHDYPMNGVKVTIKDKATAGAAADINGYAINGSFTFTAPASPFHYDVILTAHFPGVDASGDASPSAGAGAFDVKNLSPGTVLTEAAGSDLTTYTSVKGGAATFQSGDIWTVFHGMADMVRESRRRLNVVKNSFDVFFPIPGISHYSPGAGQKNISINLLDRYDWDVVAHEFGHAVADENQAVNSYAGGAHNGSNQYTYSGASVGTTDKRTSLNLAFNEAFGTWFGAALLERSDYKGVFPRVGDGKYQDTEDLSSELSFEDNTTQTYFGDDTENAGYQLLWDLEDATNEANKRTSVKTSGLRDRTSIGLVGMWGILKGSNVENVSDFWKTAFLPSGDINSFLPGVGSAVSDGAALKKALQAAESFAEFGMAPLLFKPDRGTKIELTPLNPASTSGNPKFEWSQEATRSTNSVASAGAHPDLALNKFQLVIYTNDFQTELFRMPGLTGNSYTLTNTDLGALKSAIDTLRNNGSGVAGIVATIIGESDTKTPATGPYLSNGIELLVQDYNRAVVAVVDSSGSNTDTDPTNQRIVASKQSIRNLISQADALQDPSKVPDIAAAIDFDDTVTLLSDFADPDSVVGTLDSIDSSGGTSIDGGINSAVNLLDNIAAGGFTAFFKDRASILLFTDGENNAGNGPVIEAIAAATARGIRVHYGFLSPFYTPKPTAPHPEPGAPSSPSAAPAIVRQTALPANMPATIQEAVLQSGGVFGVVSDAASQFAFVQQVFSRGLSNNDEDNAPGGKVVGQTASTEALQADIQEAAFEFSGAKNELARVIVQTTEFQAVVTVYDRDGNILGFQSDSAGNGRVEIPVTLPYSGKYTVQVYSGDGRTGLFSIFLDVQNARFTYTRVQTEEELYEELASTKVSYDTPYNGTYYGVLNSLTGNRHGLFTGMVTKGGNFSGKLVIDGVPVVLQGKLDAQGALVLDRTSNLLGAVHVNLQLAATALGHKVTGAVTGSGFSLSIDSAAGFFSTKVNPTPAAGKYTLVLPSETDPAIPGDGYATGSISAAGRVLFVGVLGDHKPFSIGTALSAESTFPISLALYARPLGSAPRGLYGEAAVRATDAGAIDGLLEWTKPGYAKDKLYPAGFSGVVPIVGSRYTAPARGHRALILDDLAGNLHLSFGTADFSVRPGEYFLTVSTANRATLAGPNALDGVSLRLAPASGLFFGSFPDYSAGVRRLRPFAGVLLQSQNRGSGHFAGATKTGFAFVNAYDDSDVRIVSAAKLTRKVGDYLNYFTQAVNGGVNYGVTGLPAGLAFYAPSGEIYGTLLKKGTFHFTISAADNSGRTATESVTLQVNP